MTGIKQVTKKKPPPTNGFKGGVSGNPSGRPKKTEQELDLIAACKAKTPDALDVLINIMLNGEQERNRMAAAQAIIERAYGKPVQPQDVKIEGNLHLTHAARPKLTRDEWLASLVK